MPISDILAIISGEKPGPPSSQKPALVARAQKRKAEDESEHAPTSKITRTSSMTNEAGRDGSDLSSPQPLDKQRNTLKPSPPSKQRNFGSGSGSRPSSDARSTALPQTSSSSTSVSTKASLSTKSITKPAGSGGIPAKTGPPKKGSFAEIMARAKNGTELRKNLGMIQHKKVEQTVTMKERRKVEEATSKMAPSSSLGRGNKAGASTSGPTAPPSSVARNGGRNALAAPSKASAKVHAAPVEKKVKKAALATTGYTGTARPRPGASNTKHGAKPGRDATTGRPDRPRYPSALSGSRRYDDYDDEMDDFIEYDDEEDAGPGRGRYDSEEDESDMEAGLSDIDQEERRADFYARREDQEQEALEKKLKREKEERKRQQLAEIRAKAGSR